MIKVLFAIMDSALGFEYGDTYPGLNNIKPGDAMKCFNKNYVIKIELANHPLLQYYLEDKSILHAIKQIWEKIINITPSQDIKPAKPPDEAQVCQCLQKKELSVPPQKPLRLELCSLFYLMSILPQVEAMKCKEFIDRVPVESWAPRLFNILLVFANWGVSVDSLQLNVPNNLPPNNMKPPNSKNVEMVLSVISTRIRPDSFTDEEKLFLIHHLVLMALDNYKPMRQNQSYFCFTIKFVVDSICVWNKTKAVQIIEGLNITQMDIQDASHVCQNVFGFASERSLSVGKLGMNILLRHVLSIAGFSYLETINLLDNLPQPTLLIESLTHLQLYVLINLLLYHTNERCKAKPPCSKETLQSVYVWSCKMQSLISINLDPLGKIMEMISRFSSFVLSQRRVLYNVGIIDNVSKD